jgi:hypothetical protein
MNVRIKKVKRETRSNLTIRLSQIEYNQVLQKALTYTEGNISEWVRYAAQNCMPRKADLEPDK